ncbi:MAG: type II toxin-antitoxin system RelE/ParE family toxin [Gemmatimonadaceae bacterium]|nr:type II toxin-antitoxin system RelE/ParE family toxin [Gemmatimonadaceae bacterium]
MTKWFARAARKDGVSRAELCRAAKALDNGQGDDLGGGAMIEVMCG